MLKYNIVYMMLGMKVEGCEPRALDSMIEL